MRADCESGLASADRVLLVTKFGSPWYVNSERCDTPRDRSSEELDLGAGIEVHYRNSCQGPAGLLPNCVSGGSVRCRSNVTSTTLLGVSRKSSAARNVLGPREDFSPRTQRGDPELNRQKRGVAPGLLSSKD